MWIGAILVIGSGAHASITLVRTSRTITTDIQVLCNQADILIGHLIWVNIFLGFHSFGLYIHNDTLKALGRREDTFGDNAIQLNPILIVHVLSAYLSNSYPSDIEVLDGKLICMCQELGTGDFMVHHIHSFTIHVTVLILAKGSLYARSSRLVADKLELGFRYPCDGPGRGGTCQISHWDHVYLALFWMYNSISIVVFHSSWKMQSDVWGTYDGTDNTISHITSGDWSICALTVNGWLSNFLWSQSSQVIQSYGSSLSGYSLVFIGAHFIWALSLMFLFSGRGYWQELIESVLWSHHKLRIVPLVTS